MLFRKSAVLSLGLALVASASGDAQVATTTSTSIVKRHNEYVVLEGHTQRENYHSPLPYTYIQEEDLPVRIVCLRHDGAPRSGLP
eukprot:jgi/Psemu1/308819/fgenesh1_kg.448_\